MCLACGETVDEGWLCAPCGGLHLDSLEHHLYFDPLLSDRDLPGELDPDGGAAVDEARRGLRPIARVRGDAADAVTSALRARGVEAHVHGGLKIPLRYLALSITVVLGSASLAVTSRTVDPLSVVGLALAIGSVLTLRRHLARPLVVPGEVVLPRGKSALTTPPTALGPPAPPPASAPPKKEAPAKKRRSREPRLLADMRIADRYQVIAALGSGGMAEIYEVEETKLGRRLALKILHSDVEASREMVARFKNEAEIIARLRHPNTVKRMDYGELDGGEVGGSFYIVTELLKGESLKDRLDRGRLSAAETLKILREVARSLAEAHQNGVVHRDVKPDNIFLERVGNEDIVKVLDFGIAKLLALDDDHAGLTLPGVVVGTPAYMSPEQVRAQGVGPPSDQYSLGIVGYRALTGVLPFEGPASAQLLAQVSSAPRPFLPSLRIDRRVERLIFRMMAKEVHSRYPSLEAVAAEIELVLAELKVPSLRSDPP